MKREHQLGRLRVEWFKSDQNFHGELDKATGRHATLRTGGKVINMHVANRVRSYWGWRFIRYAADGSWRCLGLFWLRRGHFGR